LAKTAMTMDGRLRPLQANRAPEKVYATFDFQRAWEELQLPTGGDMSVAVVDVLNFIFDALLALEIGLPQGHQILLKVADHFTFSGDYAAFLAEANTTPEAVTASFAWAAWQLAMNTSLLGDDVKMGQVEQR
jgi:hypothetical protein